MPASRLRRVVLPLVALLVIVLVAAAVLGVGLVRRSFPQAEGELEVAGLSGPVSVVRDDLGVAHIYADTPEDLFIAQGYVAAQDRFFQMDLRRHVTAGRLSELVGEGGVETDTVIRTMGWRKVAEAELPTLSPEARRYLQSYAAGVNAYLADRPSPSQVGLEYVMLAQTAPGYTIEPWDEVDSLAWLKAMAWDLRGNYTDELARARLAGDVSLNQLTSLYPDYPYDQHDPILSDDEWKADLREAGAAVTDPADESSEGSTDDSTSSDRGGAVTPESKPAKPAKPEDLAAVQETDAPLAAVQDQDPDAAFAALEDTEAALAAIPPLLAGSDGVGSNSWVVSGEHTESGMPLLANDPHLGVSQPGIWMQAGLHCREVTDACPFDVSGFTFAGFPGVVIGHNQSIAWGFTNLDPDVTDFYWEEIEDGQYRRENTWVPLDSRNEVIKVAGGDDVTIQVRATEHGPIMSDAIDGVRDAGRGAPINGVESSEQYDVSMAWTGLEKTRTAEAVFALNSATNWEEFRGAAKLFAAPSQNLVYADTEGNIGYQAPGLIPVRQSSTTGKPPGYWPSPGWDPAYDWKGWVPFSQLPNVLNPEDGVVVTANQAVSRFNTPFLTTEWDKGYRSQRILDLLNQEMARGPVTIDTMTTIQNDTYNEFANVLVPALLEIDLEDPFYSSAQELLRDWDRTAPASGDQSAPATYFYAVWAQLLEQTFNDELPNDLHATGNARWMTLTENLLTKPEDPWWDDKRTVGVVETRDEILRNAMVEARLDLTRRLSKDPQDWEWGRLHRVSMSHEVFSADGVPEIVQGMFSDGPYGMPGGSALVNANSWDAGSGTYQVTAAPSMRMVVDLADLDASRWVNQTGTSGHQFHRNYNDQTQAWIEGETYPWVHSQEAVEQAGVQTLTLRPPGSED